MISNLSLRVILTAAVLLGATGVTRAADVLVAGKVGIVSSGRLAKLVAKSKQQPGETGFPLPASGSAEDPTVGGATLELFDTETPGAGSVSFHLDASGWSGLGTPAGSLGYRYRGRDDTADANPNGTCRTVLVKETLITATCKGAAVTLVSPVAGDVGAVLRMPNAASSLRYCARFGGETKKNNARSFKRKNAPVPAECPFVAPTPTATPTVTPTATPTGTPSCSAGFAFGDACWFAGGALGQNCDQVCAGAGLVYDEATRTVAGSDGTDANCLAILDHFAFPSTWVGGVPCDDVGLGCSSMPIEFVSARCASPATTADASLPSAVRICACQ